jgi:hypothetical protein
MMLLPLYVHPLEDPDAWATLQARHGAERFTVVVNVHNGPGEQRDEAYAVATAGLAAAGVRMLGYVDLDYGTRVNGDVWRDIVGWSQYPVGGVFFDRVQSDQEGLRYVAQVVRAVRGTVVLNPGTRCSAGYSALADAVCTFEGPWTSYVEGPEGRDWSNAAHLVYGVPAGAVDLATRLLLSRAAHGLVTDLAAPLPYAGLPTALKRRVLTS